MAKKYYRYILQNECEVLIDTMDAHEVVLRLQSLINSGDDELLIYDTTRSGKLKTTLNNIALKLSKNDGDGEPMQTEGSSL